MISKFSVTPGLSIKFIFLIIMISMFRSGRETA